MNADPKKQNKCVQMSLNTPITKCKKFMQKIPRAVAMWLVDYQNNLNAESTATTVIQVWRSTREVKIGFRRKANSMTWNSDTMSKSKLNEQEHGFVDGVHPGRWTAYQGPTLRGVRVVLQFGSTGSGAKFEGGKNDLNHCKP